MPPLHAHHTPRTLRRMPRKKTPQPPTSPPSGPIYHPATGPAKPARFRTEEEQRQYERERKAARRAQAHKPGPKPGPKRRKAILKPGQVAEHLDDPALDPRARVQLGARIPLALVERLDNASHAMQERAQSKEWTKNRIVERALAAALDQIEGEHNGYLPFPPPPEGQGARERSQRTRKAQQKTEEREE